MMGWEPLFTSDEVWVADGMSCNLISISVQSLDNVVICVVKRDKIGRRNSASVLISESLEHLLNRRENRTGNCVILSND